MEAIDSSFPFDSYRKRQYGLTCNQASVLFQIRSSHFPLNAYLHRINRSETKSCLQCEPEDGPQDETVNHFLFKCEAYTEHRIKLARIISRHYLNLRDIMDNQKFMKALTTYIEKTQIFVTPHN
jgi:hypothetical protein